MLIAQFTCEAFLYGTFALTEREGLWDCGVVQDLILISGDSSDYRFVCITFKLNVSGSFFTSIQEKGKHYS